MSEPPSDGAPAAPRDAVRGAAAEATDAAAATDANPDTTEFDEDDEYEWVDDDDPEKPAPVVDPMVELELGAAQEVFLLPPRAHDKSWLLLITLALFVGATMLQGSASTLTELAILIGVILLHELGHALAMLAFRYSDVRVFFIPFFGAAASGRRYGVARWKQGLVLMMGPLPGLVLGCVLLVSGEDGLVRTAALQLVAINAFNLLPIAPFDGGQLFNLVVFSRHRHLEIGFLTIASLGVIGLALLLGAWIFGVIGLFMLLSIPARKQVLAAANELRADNLPEDPRALDEPQRRRLFTVLWDMMPVAWRGKPAHQAAMMAQVHENAAQRPLSVDASVGLGALWIVGVAITAFAVSTVIDARPTDAPVPPALWQRYHDTAGTFTIELPAQPIESKDPQPMLMSTYGNRDYGVIWKPITSDEKWKNFGAAISADATKVRDLSIPDSDAAFVMKTKQGLYVAVRIVRGGPIGYLVVAGAYVDDPESERVVRSFRLEPTRP